jgi:D-3-phosphoglycerate dehydrogenase
MVSLEELLSTSDIVSLHAPLTPESKHLLNASTLRLMKPDAFVVNTSRGGLVDQDALAAAIRNGKLAGAGLDVFSPEPPDLSHPLFAEDKVVVTPHAAFVSEESLIELRERVSQQVLDVLQGRSPENIVNRR